VFAFTNGYGGKADGYDATKVTSPIQPRVGVFAEAGLARLDLILAKAAQYGIRLILPLSNWWDEMGGCQWYVDQVLGKSTPPKAKELFFTEPKVREAFADYMYAVLTRVNSLTGVAYREDPAVLAWELQVRRGRGGSRARARGAASPPPLSPTPHPHRMSLK